VKFTSVNTLEATPAERKALIADLAAKFPKVAPFLRDAEIDEAKLAVKGKLPALGATDVDLGFDIVEPG
jgi:hypothetical protein